MDDLGHAFIPILQSSVDRLVQNGKHSYIEARSREYTIYDLFSRKGFLYRTHGKRRSLHPLERDGS